MGQGIDNGRLNLRAGEWVEVRSADAILATLDADGRLDGMPFMPEMFAFCGRRFRVWKRAHKTCDTVNNAGGRRVHAAVHLDDVRCDGREHGGCEAACLIFWKEAWLTRVDGRSDASGASSPVSSLPQRDRRSITVDDVNRAACPSGSPNTPDAVYACQATLLPQATTFLPWWDVRQYIEDYTSGNVSLWQLISGGAYVCYYGLVTLTGRISGRAAKTLMRAYDAFQIRRGGVPYPRRTGTVPPGTKTPSCPQRFRSGDLIKVRTYEEILATLDWNNKNRGLYFDAEEVPYCSETRRVRSTVSRILDERTGRMIELKERNVILDGAICQGRYSDHRMFCPRAIFSIWRETWLEPADGDPRTATPAPRS